MKDNHPMSWKTAVWDTKGPSTPRQMIMLFLKGVFMGVANIIPGVSGGTIALITGIYTELLQAIGSFNLETLRFLKQFQLKQALHTLHLRFLVPVMAGAALAILSLAHIMTFVFTRFPEQTWALFFGLLLASILVMAVKIRNWIGTGGLAFIIGTTGAYFFVDMIPVTTPDTWWFILIAGMIVICTMILPGLSGAFLLLILGKYEFIIGALKQPFIPANFIILAIFGIGCIVGIMAFTRVLSVMLERYENATMAALTGVMCGSMRKIWPWKEVLEKRVIQGKEKIISEINVLPGQLDGEFYIALGLILVGFILVIVLEKFANQKS
jgi:putative membrane protein